MHQIILAGKTVLGHKAYGMWFFILTPLIFFLFVLIPVYAIPSNTFQLQFTLYIFWNYVTLILLSLLGSLFILMHIYSFQKSKEYKKRLSVIGKGGLGGSAGALASIFGAATCPMCVASIFGFLGFSAVGFLIRYQWFVFLIALVFMLISLYFISRKVSGLCEDCK